MDNKVREIITEALNSMGCENIEIHKNSESSVTVTFDCKKITSFISYTPGWTYSGIQLDKLGRGQYKIDFTELTSAQRASI